MSNCSIFFSIVTCMIYQIFAHFTIQIYILTIMGHELWPDSIEVKLLNCGHVSVLDKNCLRKKKVIDLYLFTCIVCLFTSTCFKLNCSLFCDSYLFVANRSA